MDFDDYMERIAEEYAIINESSLIDIPVPTKEEMLKMYVSLMVMFDYANDNTQVKTSTKERNSNQKKELEDFFKKMGWEDL